VLWLFFKEDLCSATSFKMSRRELSIDMAEYGSILKNNQNTYSLKPHLSFTLKRTLWNGCFVSVIEFGQLGLPC